MVKRWFFTLIIILFITSPIPVFGVSDTVVINSFRLRTNEKSTDEFVELYNAGINAVSLKDWRIRKYTSGGTSYYNLLTTFPEITLEASESLIIAHKDYSDTADLFYSTSYSLAEDNSLVLYSDAGKTEIDRIGWGSAKLFEGTPLPNLKPDEIWERKEPGLDTDNNMADFELRATVSETGESPVTGTKDNVGAIVSSLFITELMPNPEGADSGKEWVEFFNGGTDLDLSGYSLTDKLGSVKTYYFPSGFSLTSEQYFVFPLKGTGISLNNDGDALEIKDPDGRIVASSGSNYGTAKEGASWSYDGAAWQWTKVPTPGAVNIIEVPVAATKAKTTKSKTVKKAAIPKASVKGSSAEADDLFEAREQRVNENDKKIGMILIVLALVGGLAYTVYTNWSQIREVYLKERKKYYQFRQKIRQKTTKG